MAGDGYPAMCPACGRPTPPLVSTGEVHCSGCGLLLAEYGRPAAFGDAEETATAPSTPATPAPAPAAPGSLPAGTLILPSVPSSNSRAGCIISAVVVAIVLVAVGGAMLAVIRVTHHLAATTRRSFAVSTNHLSLSSGDQILLPGEPHRPLGLAGLFYDGSKDQRVIGRARLGTSSMIWQSAPLASGVSSAVLAVDGNRLFVGAKDRLMAYDLAGGALLWTAPLSDEVETSCPTCMVAVGGSLVVQTRDAVVSGFAPATGRSLWQRRLVAANGKLLVVGSQLAVTDRLAPPASGGYVALVDPATGRDARRIQPTCPTPEDPGFVTAFQPFDLIRAIPGTTHVALTISAGSACLQRWDLATGRQVFSVPLARAGSITDDRVQVGATQMVVSSGSTCDVFDLATGRSQAMTVAPDETVKPVQLLSSVLVGVVTQTRGSARPALAAWDTPTGRQLWTHPVEGRTPFSPPSARTTDVLFTSETGHFLAAADGARVRLVTMDRQATALEIVTINAATGATTGDVHGNYQAPNESGSYSVGIERVQGDELVITVDSLLQTIDLAKATVTATWPSS